MQQNSYQDGLSKNTQIDMGKTWFTEARCCCRYNTYIAHYKELECMRISLEPLLYEYGVDIIFAG